MRRMKNSYFGGNFHTYRNADTETCNASTSCSTNFHTGVCGVHIRGVYVTQANAQNKSPARPGARASGDNSEVSC